MLIVIWRANDICIGRVPSRRLLGGTKDAMIPRETLKELNRLKSKCSAKSSIYSPLMLHYFLLLFCHGRTSVPNPVELAISPVFRRLCGFMIPSLLLAVVRASTQFVY